jgi:hypothetical protein
MSNVRSFRGAGAACETGTHAHGPVSTADGPVFMGSGPGPVGHPGMTFMTVGGDRPLTGINEEQP